MLKLSTHSGFHDLFLKYMYICIFQEHFISFKLLLSGEGRGMVFNATCNNISNYFKQLQVIKESKINEFKLIKLLKDRLAMRIDSFN
jgi:hypothetical protein